ncbi:MAG: hypothetical protein DMG08_23395 [Acidobacteria bacterium]|nr:MAG: hypothetical protein DMG08_23395 [Acidobacteriota bacterium]
MKVVIDEKDRNAGNQEMHANGQQQRTPPRLAILPRGDGNCQGIAQERRYEWGWWGTEDKVAEESPPLNRFGRLFDVLKERGSSARRLPLLFKKLNRMSQRAPVEALLRFFLDVMKQRRLRRGTLVFTPKPHHPRWMLSQL